MIDQIEKQIGKKKVSAIYLGTKQLLALDPLDSRLKDDGNRLRFGKDEIPIYQVDSADHLNLLVA